MPAKAAIKRICSVPVSCRERYVPLADERMAAWRSAEIKRAGVSDLVGGYALGLPDVSDLILIATVAGAGTARTTTAEHVCLPNTILLAMPGEGIELRVLDDEWQLAWWYLKPDGRWRDSLRTLTWLSDCPHAAMWYHQVHGMLDALALNNRDGDRIASSHADSLLLELEHATNDLVETNRDVNHPALAALWREIDMQLHLPWTIHDMAHWLNIGETTLKKLMQQHYGQTARRFLMARRMHAARQLLTQTSYPFKLIAERVGYASPSAFTRVFRDETGMSPADWRGKRAP